MQGPQGSWCLLVGKGLDGISRSLAGTAQIHYKGSDSTRKTHTKLILPHLSSPSFFLFYLHLLIKVLLLLLLLRCPESRMPTNHSGASLALPCQPLAQPNPGFSCLGLRTVRFYASKMFSNESIDYSCSALKMHFKNK